MTPTAADQLDEVELGRGRVQALAAVIGADHDVLDARAPRVAHVDPRLDAEGVARHQRLGVGGDDVRLLVGLHADAVAGPMQERLAVAGIGDDVARDGVDLGRRDAGAHRIARRGLRLAQDREETSEVGRRLADERRPRRVAGVSGLRPADVEDDRIPGTDRAGPGLVVRAGRVGSGGNDGEARVVVPLADEQLADVAADLGLGATGEALTR